MNNLAEESTLDAVDNGPLNNIPILNETYECETWDDKQTEASTDDVSTETLLEVNDIT